MASSAAAAFRLLLVATLLAVAARAYAADPPLAAQLRGTWETDAYAELIEVGDSQVVYYDATAATCIETDRRPLSHFDQRFRGGISARGRNSVTLVDRAGIPYPMHRLPALPERCRNGGTVGTDPMLNFDTFLRYFEENYGNSDAQHVDWRAIRAEFAPRVTHATTADQLIDIYRQILARIDDVHVFWTNGRSGAEERFLSAGRPSGLRAAVLRQNPGLSQSDAVRLDETLAPVLNDVILYDVLKGRFSTDLQGKFQWGWVTPDIGYLNIRQMSGLFNPPATDPAQVEGPVRAVMERILGEFAGARALILDVRQNRGGSDQVALIIASYFADHPLALRMRARTRTDYTAWHPMAVVPSATHRFTRPVYLLTSDNSVSAAESLVAAMKDYANVTLVGTHTRGALNEILMKRLPDGSMLAISELQVEDAEGVNYEARGIPPDVVVESYPPDRLVSGYRDAVDAAVRLANAH